MFYFLVIVLLITAGFAMWSNLRDGLRQSHDALKKEHANQTKQLDAAKAALIKIAANSSGNPSLDANIALEDINVLKMKELE